MQDVGDLDSIPSFACGGSNPHLPGLCPDQQATALSVPHVNAVPFCITYLESVDQKKAECKKTRLDSLSSPPPETAACP